jgi:hypothetical protein
MMTMVNMSSPLRSSDQAWPCLLSLSRLSAPSSTVITITAACSSAVPSQPTMAGRLK